MVEQFSVTSRVQAASARISLRDCLFGLVMIGFANAEYLRVVRQIDRTGLWEAAYSTFGISMVVWASIYVVARLILSSPDRNLKRADLAILGASLVLFLSPATALSSVGLTMIAIYYGLTEHSLVTRRAMRVLLALTIATLWARFSFSFFLPYILRADAVLVSLVSGLERSGNLILASDNATLLQIGVGCSSFMNLSNAALGWYAAMSYFDKKLSVYSSVNLAASVLVILIINTFRISLIGWFPQHFELIHGQVGSNIANIVSSLTILFFSMQAVKR